MLEYDRRLLGEILVDLDEHVNKLDREVFEAAHPLAVGNLDAQCRAAMASSFRPPVKIERNRKMEQRNLIAKLLGFGPRLPHDLSPRDYVIATNGLLLPRGTV